MTTSAGTLDSTMTFFPFGECLESQGTLATDRKFTGQRLDDTGLYSYGARYYDYTIGRFISADTVVQSFSNPQTLNRYSYVTNNPLRYTDPTGHVLVSDDGGTPPPPKPPPEPPKKDEPKLPVEDWDFAEQGGLSVPRGLGASWGVIQLWPDPSLVVTNDMIITTNPVKMATTGGRYIHLDEPHGQLKTHINADVGPLATINNGHIEVPTLGPHLKTIGRSLVVVGAATDVYNIAMAVNADQGKIGPNTMQAVNTSLGGWGGAIGGAAIGTAICPVVGTIIGGIIGGFGGSWLGSNINKWIR